MSLSELSRLPVSNLRLSAHISAPWTRKKKKMSKRQQSLVRKQRSGRTEALHCFKSTLSARRQQRPRGGGGVGGGPGPSAWVSAACWGLRAACQAPSCENRTVCLCSRKKKKNAQLLRTLQNQLALTFTSAFCHFFSDMASTQGRASVRNVISGLLL